MVETRDEQDPQTVDPSSQKRKPDLDCVEQGEKKKQKNHEEDLKEEAEEEQRQKARALDKGKGKMVIEEEEEDSDSDSDSDDDGLAGGVVGGEGDDSDFCDDPLAEVDLENILPSRTRRRAPQMPGAYLVNDQDAEEDEDDDDEDVGGDEDEEDSD